MTSPPRNTTPRAIWSRILEIEEECRVRRGYRSLFNKHTNDPMNDAEWKTNPLAVEYRELLKLWWEFPSIPNDVMKEIGEANRPMITRKGGMQTWAQRQGQSLKLTKSRKLFLRLSGRSLPEKRRKSRKG